MQIQILNVTKTPATSKAGKPYTFLDIAFKNLTFQGKVEGKKLMPFGDNAPAFQVLEQASSGELFDIQVVKNAAGFNDWVTAKLSDGTAPAPSATPAYGKTAAPAAVRSTYETPEERATKQVYIIRQSNLNSAVALLSAGAKTTPKLAEVLATAKQMEAYVFGKDAIAKDDFENMDEDVPL